MNQQQVLIIDDDPVFADTLKKVLERRQLACLVAHDSKQAAGLMQTHRFDYLLVDLRLQEESGLDLIEPLRSRYPDAVILVLTGYSSIATAVDAVKRGADDYLPKPVRTPDLLRAMGLQAGSAIEVEQSVQPPSLDRLEWEQIQRSLANNDGNISATARELGMHRRTLQRKLAKRPVQH